MEILTIRLKILINNIFHRFTTRSLQKKLIEKTFLSKNKKKELKKLIYKGNVVCGYIPFLKNQTIPIIYNFFSTNYGIRKNLTLVFGITDHNFKVHWSSHYELNHRESLVIENELIDELSKFNSDLFIAMLIDSKIPINHGKDGGHLRYWGTWNRFSSFVHAMPLPTPVSFLRQKFGLTKNYFFDRLMYPLSATQVVQYSPFKEKILIPNRGDLSGKLSTQYGFTIIKNKEKKVCSTFHNAPLTRIERISNKNLQSINHIVALPPYKNLDVDMFFGECCSNNSTFFASLYESFLKDTEPRLIESKTIKIKTNESIKASDIFGNFILSENPQWISFIPQGGLHAPSYVELFYCLKGEKKVFDCVHSHSFGSTNPHLKFKPRTLKFAPFSLQQFSQDINKDIVNYPYLCIWGDTKKDLQMRLRIFCAGESSFEDLLSIKVRSKHVEFFNLNEIFKIRKHNISSHVGICQIESEDGNLNASLFNGSFERNCLINLATDHLTGG